MAAFRHAAAYNVSLAPFGGRLVSFGATIVPSYDSMASLLAPYGSQSAFTVAMDLDAKVENLLKTAAS